MSQKNNTGDFGDFSLSDDDLYRDFLQKEKEYDNDQVEEDNNKESILLGEQSSHEKNDNLSSLEEEIAKNKTPRSHGDIQNLMSMVKKDRDYDISDDAANEDMLEAFRRQQMTNKHISSSISGLPTDLYLLDDPIETSDDNTAARAGDENIFSKGKIAIISLAALSLVILSVSIYINVKPDEKVEAQPPEVTQGAGDVINNAISDDDLTATVTQTQSANGDSTDSDDESSDSSSDRNSEDIRYEIVSEGGIKTASISYINASGSRESETGVTLPWKKTVTNASSITPHIAANPGERGTLTCKIYRGSEKIAEDTAAGEKASVECKS